MGTVMSPSGLTHTAWNACPLLLLLPALGMLAHPACSIPLPIPHFWDLSGQAWLQLTLALSLHTCLWNLLFVCPVGSMAAGPADLDFRVGTVITAVQLPVKANLSSSIFFWDVWFQSPSPSATYIIARSHPLFPWVDPEAVRSHLQAPCKGKAESQGAQASVAQFCCPWLGTGWWLELVCIKHEWGIEGNLNEQIFSILFSKQWSWHMHISERSNKLWMLWFTRGSTELRKTLPRESTLFQHLWNMHKMYCRLQRHS